MHRSRREILNILKQVGSAKADTLAQQMGLATMTVRQHLNVLQRDGLVGCTEVRQGPGRPYYAYSLTAEAENWFPKQYSWLAEKVLEETKNLLGPEVAGQVIDRVGQALAKEFLSRGPANDGEARVEEFVAFLEEKGFLASWEKTPTGYRISNSNCPFHSVARMNQEICRMDESFRQAALGLPTKLASCVLNGNHCCTYEVYVNAEERQPA